MARRLLPRREDRLLRQPDDTDRLESPLPVRVGSRQFNRMPSTSIPAFRVEMTFAGIKTISWVTDTGDVVREESQMGLASVREPQEVAIRMAVGRGGRTDL